MLDTCLGDVSLETFQRSYLSRAAFAQPSTLIDRPPLDWDMLDHVLRSSHPDILVVAAGQLLAWKPPGAVAELRAYMANVVAGAHEIDVAVVALGTSR